MRQGNWLGLVLWLSFSVLAGWPERHCHEMCHLSPGAPSASTGWKLWRNELTSIHRFLSKIVTALLLTYCWLWQSSHVHICLGVLAYQHRVGPWNKKHLIHSRGNLSLDLRYKMWNKINKKCMYMTSINWHSQVPSQNNKLEVDGKPVKECLNPGACRNIRTTRNIMPPAPSRGQAKPFYGHYTGKSALAGTFS